MLGGGGRWGGGMMGNGCGEVGMWFRRCWNLGEWGGGGVCD